LSAACQSFCSKPKSEPLELPTIIIGKLKTTQKNLVNALMQKAFKGELD